MSQEVTMDKPGKQGPNNDSSRPKGQSHPQGPRHEAPRLSPAENYSNPKTRADEALRQAADTELPRPSTASKGTPEAERHAARGDDDLMSQEPQVS
ncbi:hypothetical protein [Pseudomonas sp. PDM20]|uniref:hypothetical protein n=1 Tax=Pseudomonas sp. PDM20 TaxID=2769254 RepID=UPI003CFFC483